MIGELGIFPKFLEDGAFPLKHVHLGDRSTGLSLSLFEVEQFRALILICHSYCGHFSLSLESSPPALRDPHGTLYLSNWYKE